MSSGEDQVVRRKLEIVNRLGLHARAATLFVKVAAGFSASVAVSAGGETVDGKSIIGLMMLAAGQGTEIDVETRGCDAAEAVEALAKLVAARFDEPS